MLRETTFGDSMTGFHSQWEGPATPRTGRRLGEAEVDVSGDLLHQDGCPLQGPRVNFDLVTTAEDFCQCHKSKPESKKIAPPSLQAQER